LEKVKMGKNAVKIKAAINYFKILTPMAANSGTSHTYLSTSRRRAVFDSTEVQ
jgi:hypothetical protein